MRACRPIDTARLDELALAQAEHLTADDAAE